MITIPFLGPFLEATGMILEKKVLKNKNLDYKNYTIYEFLSIIIIMSTFIYFVWDFDGEALKLNNILIFAFVIIISVLANLFTFYSLKRENLTEFEPVWLMQPLFTIILAFMFFSAERNWVSFVFALVASLSLVLSHVKRHHLFLDKYIMAAILGSFFFALELVASKPLLSHYSSFTFYFIRCFFILIITYIIYRPNFQKVGNKNWLLILITGSCWVFYRAIIYYGYETSGIVFTTTIFILSPVIMFLFAILFLKEKPTLRQIISTIIIILCVLGSVLIGN